MAAIAAGADALIYRSAQRPAARLVGRGAVDHAGRFDALAQKLFAMEKALKNID